MDWRVDLIEARAALQAYGGAGERGSGEAGKRGSGGAGKRGEEDIPPGDLHLTTKYSHYNITSTRTVLVRYIRYTVLYVYLTWYLRLP